MEIYVERVDPGEWVFGATGYAGPRWIALNLDLLKVNILFSYARKSYRRKTK